MEAEHSPAPWKVRYSIAGPIVSVVDATGALICDMICPVGGIPVSDINAYLIAAAPDLLEEAETIVAYENVLPRRVVLAARAAIANAKGE